MRSRVETFHFVVVCPHATAIYLLGDFNNWSTTATPLQPTERDVWQLDLLLPGGHHDFSYFVIDDRWRTGRAPFGNTFMLPGTWATVVRNAAPANVELKETAPSYLAQVN
jgi:1,4-alpha-glucan branching enzyme